MELGDLTDDFREFRELKNKCKFTGCTHTHEPDCAIKDALDKGEISKSRYDSYVIMLQEIQKFKERNMKK